MRSDGANPCNCCEAKDKASGCDNCVLNIIIYHGECQNNKCMLNYECGCLLSLDDVCKASTCYEDDYRAHDCSECIHIGEIEGEHWCEITGDMVCQYDTACADFKEVEE